MSDLQLFNAWAWCIEEQIQNTLLDVVSADALRRDSADGDLRALYQHRRIFVGKLRLVHRLAVCLSRRANVLLAVVQVQRAWRCLLQDQGLL